MKSGDNHKAFNLGFLLCFAPRNSWNENATLLMKFGGVFFFLLITISQAVECQKVIPGFSEFSVTHRCVSQGPLWFWQLKKEAESPVRSRGSEDQVIDWDQRGKLSPPPTHETAFIALPFESSQNFVQSIQYPYWRKILHSLSYWKTYFLCLALFWPYDHICFLTHPQYNLKPRRSQKDYTLSPF